MMNSIKKQNNALLFVIIVVSIFFLFSCTGSKSIAPGGEKTSRSNIPLGNTYDKIIIQKFEIDQDLEKKYPGVTVTCESTAMDELLKVSSISQIEKTRTSLIRQRGALLVKTRVTALRLMGSSAENQPGVPEMAVNIRLIDSFTGRILREKDLSTLSDTSMSDSGNSDQFLPYNLGVIIAKYVAAALDGN